MVPPRAATVRFHTVFPVDRAQKKELNKEYDESGDGYVRENVFRSRI
jgi:hypothetical protein